MMVKKEGTLDGEKVGTVTDFLRARIDWARKKQQRKNSSVKRNNDEQERNSYDDIKCQKITVMQMIV